MSRRRRTTFSPKSVGSTRDAEVHLAALAELQLDAAVLRQTPLGDVELRHDLEPRGQRVLELQRRLHHLVEQAVDPVAHTERFLVGLDVDVRRDLLDGVGEDQIDELDDGGVFRLLRHLAGIFLVIAGHEIDAGVVEARHHVVEEVLVGFGVVGLDRGANRLLGGDDGLDVVAREELDVVEGEDVRRVGGSEDERRAGPIHGDDVVFSGDVFGDQSDDFGLDREVREIDRGNAILFGDELGELVLVHEAKSGDLRTQAFAMRSRLLSRLVELLRREQILLDQEFTDALVQRGPSPA